MHLHLTCETVQLIESPAEAIPEGSLLQDPFWPNMEQLLKLPIKQQIKSDIVFILVGMTIAEPYFEVFSQGVASFSDC